MQFTGQHLIPAPRLLVWQQLNDAETLRACVPGCESLEQQNGDEFTAVVVSAIGPVKARFKGRLVLSNRVVPVSYLISGKGEGGIAGFGSMTASVQLEDGESGDTVLNYSAEASVGGKLAQIGSRLVGSAANKLAREFFERFNARLSAMATEMTPADVKQLEEAYGNQS